MKKKYNFKTDETVRLIVSKLSEKGFTIRYEKGRFQSSYCIANGSKIIFLNKKMSKEQIIDFLESYLEESYTA